jgi:tripartite-type tricarboxylate transporter receptor subunit TctC
MVGFLPVHVAQNFVSSGKLIALAVGGAARHPVAPGVATIQELGVSGVNVDIWYAFFVPAKVPAPVINRLNTEIAAIIKLPEVRSLLTNAGLDAMSSTSMELSATLRKDYARWGSVIKRNGIEID